ncbi:phosphatidate cytidylyltransferase [Mycoplasmopsis columbina]|uniref:phosphatidate cytidylyltransferase n=1 Tax=Mycoplasmopsis columbina TaxID=114881 RepID=UPI0006892ACF|nr:phosphatidate cytidylyltransferase [Mycoplasmopsis columbina]VEU76644.1 Phosphatidate cytidylyltransferase [Mycoplasmopsis columbina]
MKLLKERIIPAIILALLGLAFLIPVSLFSPKESSARIVSFIVTYLLMSVAFFELFKAHRMKWYFALLFAIITSVIVIFPLESFKSLNSIGNSNDSINSLQNFSKLNNQTQNSVIYSFIQIFARDFYTPIILVFVSLSFFALEYLTKTQITLKDRLWRALFIFVTLYIMSMAIKTLNLYITFKYQYWLTALLIPVIHDTFGFFGGKYFGKKFIKVPLAPIISPKKTWEGFIVGVGGAMIATAGLTFGFNLFQTQNQIIKYVIQVLFVIAAPFIAAIGDLYFSLIKRMNGIKDYSKIFVGHGGFLDRFDGLLFTLFLMFLLTMFIQ